MPRWGVHTVISKQKVTGIIAVAAGVAMTFLAIRFVYPLGIALALWQPLIRPAGVSKSAHFVSTFEDGTWFDCSVDTPRNVDICRAWDEGGRLIANGDFRLEDEDRAATPSELHPSMILANNGKAYMIYLYGPYNKLQGKVLLPVVNGRRIGVPIVTTNP